jgi:uncharacterized protein (TIGR03067 family)
MRTFALLTATLLALSARGAPAPLPRPDPSKADLKRMQGTWDLVSERNGRRVCLPPVGWQVVVAGKRVRFREHGKVSSEWECTLDARKRPKRLDLRKASPSGKVLLRAVYSLEGNTFTFCFDNTGGGPPADMRRIGPTHILYVLERVKR